MQVGSPVFPPQQPGLDVPLLLFMFLGWNRGQSLRSPTCHVAAGLMVVQGPLQPWQLPSARFSGLCSCGAEEPSDKQEKLTHSCCLRVPSLHTIHIW